MNERTVKALRKPVRCCACSSMLLKGETAVRWSGVTDGDFSTSVYHVDCREAELALNQLHGTWDPDEWLGLWDLDWEDHRWLVETWPAVAARKSITLAAVEEHEREREECRLAWKAIDAKRRADATGTQGGKS